MLTILEVPSDYEDLLAYYTHRGFRVIACATRYIPKVNWVRVQKMKRDEAESELDFIGFIIFENKLKPSTTGVLSELSHAGIRKVMCTGDNILTAISVARECNLMDRNAHCFVPHFAEGMCASRFFDALLIQAQEIFEIQLQLWLGRALTIIYINLMAILLW
jgi:magnesium-transporting ATPase (P-type)